MPPSYSKAAHLDAAGHAGGGEELIVAVEADGAQHVARAHRVARLQRRTHLQGSIAKTGMRLETGSCKHLMRTVPPCAYGNSPIPSKGMALPAQLHRAPTLSLE